MKFIDEAVIHVQAGNGGSGSKHFRREKYVPLGGPDGGNGGQGGSVILKADANKHTLLDFKFNPHWRAESGRPGGGSLKDGKAGEDLYILVPVGTEVRAVESNTLVCDLNEDGQSFILAQGGRGGKGNAFFKSPTNQAPQHFQPGEPGQAGSFMLSLKLVADVGLIGFPNAGKSTLISRISAARPKIADYPFTTLTPNLGVVQTSDKRSFVVADIPGLIPGAHEGKGLGTKFLKHVERTKILVHLLDPLQLDENGEHLPPQQAFAMINAELASFSPELASRKQIVVLTKIDAVSDRAELEELVYSFRQEGRVCLAVSSASGENIPELIRAMAREVLS
ncbi:MAG: GTPase ObgE [Deltaproteobacteria bacterium]|nr:GTPase ObgE [Deltaproteobacteria bacterium]